MKKVVDLRKVWNKAKTRWLQRAGGGYSAYTSNQCTNGASVRSKSWNFPASGNGSIKKKI